MSEQKLRMNSEQGIQIYSTFDLMGSNLSDKSLLTVQTLLPLKLISPQQACHLY